MNFKIGRDRLKNYTGVVKRHSVSCGSSKVINARFVQAANSKKLFVRRFLLFIAYQAQNVLIGDVNQISKRSQLLSGIISCGTYIKI